MHKLPLSLSAIALLSFSAISLQAQTNFRGWTGNTSSDWNDASNWDSSTIPSGPNDVAAVRHSTNNPAVIGSGSNISVQKMFIGENETGSVTVDSGATVDASGGNSVISKQGSLTVNGSWTGNTQFNNDATLSIGAGGTYNGNLTLNSASAVSINGNVNGNFQISSTGTQIIGTTGSLIGDFALDGTDNAIISGTILGEFRANQDSSATINSTADIRSTSNNSWFYNNAAITWNVAADGSVATLRTSRNESTAGAFDGEWRYDASTSMTVNLDDFAGGTIVGMALVSGIQNESTFADNVLFTYNGVDVSTEFTFSDGSFSGTLAAVPELSTVGMLTGFMSLFYVVLCRRR